MLPLLQKHVYALISLGNSCLEHNPDSVRGIKLLVVAAFGIAHCTNISLIISSNNCRNGKRPTVFCFCYQMFCKKTLYIAQLLWNC